MRLPVYALLTVTAFSVVLALSSAPSQAQGPGGPGGPGGGAARGPQEGQPRGPQRHGRPRRAEGR